MRHARARQPIPINGTQTAARRLSHLLLYLVLIAGAVLMLLPFAYMLSTSLKPLNEVFSTPVKWIPVRAALG